MSENQEIENSSLNSSSSSYVQEAEEAAAEQEITHGLKAKGGTEQNPAAA